MSKGMRNTLIIIAIVLLLFAIIFAIYSHFKTQPVDANHIGNLVLNDANEGLENVLNDILEENNNTEEVDNTENTQSNTNTQTSGTSNKNEDKTEEGNQNDTQTTPKEKKAIELAKEAWKKGWGNLEGVFFRNESIQGDGKYVVSVHNSSTTTTMCFYVIDVATGVVEER